MSTTLIGTKSIQTQMFDSEGKRIPTSFIKTSPCYLLDVKATPQAGHFIIMLGSGQMKNVKKSVQGKITKAGIKTPLRFLREFRINGENITLQEEKDKKVLTVGEVKTFVGSEVKADIFFKVGDMVDVAAVSKGKGFQGVVKRHGFAGGPRTHGQSDRERAPGSIGQATTPGRVFKGKRMAGRMGGVRVTVKNLKVVEVNGEGIKVKGLVGGPLGGLVEVFSHKR